MIDDVEICEASKAYVPTYNEVNKKSKVSVLYVVYINNNDSSTIYVLVAQVKLIKMFQ